MTYLYKHHQSVEEIGKILADKKNMDNTDFFNIITAYFITKLASCMSTVVRTNFTGDIPVNNYTIALATSGFGKGTSVTTIEKEFIGGFKEKFLQDVFPAVADNNLFELATQLAVKNNSDVEEEKQKLDSEFIRLGPPYFAFDDGSAPATKQLRDKYILADIGSINLQIDEFGSNLGRANEVLNTFLELYDMGLVKPKITKQSDSNKRTPERNGATPANLLMFGTTNKLLDGAKTEQDFYELLETGYSRRCFYTFGFKPNVSNNMTPEEVYAKLTSKTNKELSSKWRDFFTSLANVENHKKVIILTDNIGIKLIEYKMYCEKLAEDLPESATIKRAELINRYFKAIKLAGTYAFLDGSGTITEENLKQAIHLTEISGDHFDKILSTDSAYVKLAKHIADSKHPLTHADLHEQLPFYKDSAVKRKEMLDLAVSWGYKNNVIIKQETLDNIQFFSGSKLEETNLDKLIVSVSNHEAYNYTGYKDFKFKFFKNVTETNNAHWTTHTFKNNHRREEYVNTGFNLLVLDLDKNIKIDTIKDIMSDYTYFMYTTKRHTDENHRCRLVLPIKYILNLSSKDYKQFYNNIIEFLPFDIDDSGNQRSKKWLSNQTDNYWFNEAELFDPIRFIPKTSRNNDLNQELSKLTNLSSVDKWFVLKMKEGNRNQNLIRYALMLKDSGQYDYPSLEKAVFNLNKQLTKPLSENEIKSTILKTIARKFNEQ